MGGGGLFGGMFGGGGVGGSSLAIPYPARRLAASCYYSRPRLNALWIQASPLDSLFIEDLILAMDIEGAS